MVNPHMRSGHGLVCVPAFADNGTSWRALFEALVGEGFEVFVVDLPGFGMSAPDRDRASIAGAADLVAQVAQRWDEVSLVGHSLGSVIAVEAAWLLGSRCAGLVSIEGNLTPEDAYFSGLAAEYADPSEFQSALAERVDRLVAAGSAPSSYADAVRAADAVSMHALGCDAREQGADGRFGVAYRGLSIPTLYLWSPASTVPETSDYLRRHSVVEHEFAVGHHWPWTRDPGLVAGIISRFFHAR
ncbi:alpha/beta fold hydrolase [Actinocrispum wychmicini]|uniref:Pimeloyl-ACP methyl ester carboxylesterase n=1 Tax=Actinocrispum wychmicini TaxID=1213861 RepID=A0A4V2S880_9PSEU|nr:alpha/beta fold hydrolase [Actinocrispum wychmicini]TCO62770.1 pimeloyl-ACP methyl ester carboxylesterase [Actinocrispum wychmicini]